MASIATTLVHNRELPWVQHGTKIDGDATIAEALEAGGLDWNVELRKIYVENVRGNKSIIKDRFATVRTDTDEPLGVVGKSYVPYSNAQALNFADELVSGGAKIQSVGAMLGGRQIFAVLEMPGHIEVARQHDEVALYLLLRTSHNGTKAVTIDITPVNLRCTNQMGSARARALHKWSARHVGTLEAKVTEARRTLTLVDRFKQEFTEAADRLAAIDVSIAEFTAVLADVLPLRNAQGKENRVNAELHDRITHNWRTSQTIADDLRLTGWGALNAVTEVMDWQRERRSPDARLYHAVDGQSSKTRETVARRLLSLA